MYKTSAKPYESRPCPGDHTPHAEHCLVCAPFWGYIPTCPTCGSKLSIRESGDLLCARCRLVYKRADAVQVGADLQP